MSARLATVVALSLALTGAPSVEAAPRPSAAGKGAAGKGAAEARDRDTASPARDRQNRCGAEWRGLSAAERTAKGPTWPNFYSRCVKRLKEPRA